jgi:cytoskeletal protein CcmA (bactofilin family)
MSIARHLGGAAADARRAASQSVTKFASFGRDRPDAGEHQPLAAANEDAGAARPDPSVLSANTEVKGAIATTDELYVQGKIEGDIRATSIIVCPGGVVRGDLVAESIAVYGTVKGNIHGGHVRLCTGAIVDGEIAHTTLGIEAGASFEGTIKRSAAETPAAAE